MKAARAVVIWVLGLISALLDLGQSRRIRTELCDVRPDTAWRRVGKRIVAMEHTTLRGGWLR